MIGRWKRVFLLAPLIALLFGAIAGSVTLYVAIQENSMGEFFCNETGDLDIWYSAEWFLIAAMYFGLIALGVECVVLFIAWLFRQLLTRGR